MSAAEAGEAEEAGETQAAAAARAVADVTDKVFAPVSALAEAYRSRWAALEGSGRAVAAAELEPLTATVHAWLDATPVLIGCGVVAAPDLLSDRSRHLVWWERGGLGGGVPKRLVLDLDTGAEDSYDYPSMPWFTTPRDENRRTVFGPYVDYRGANRYVYTFAVPVRAGDSFLGVAGADVAVQTLEPALLGALKPLTADAVVVSADRRVVVANSARWAVGSRLKSFPEAGVAGFRAVHPVGDDLGWVVAVAEEPPLHP